MVVEEPTSTRVSVRDISIKEMSVYNVRSGIVSVCVCVCVCVAMAVFHLLWWRNWDHKYFLAKIE